MERGGVVCARVTDFSTSGRRLQRPNVYLPVHLYGQLVHDKTGCHLLEAQVMNERLQLQVLHSAVSRGARRPRRDLAAVHVVCSCVCVQSIVPDLSYTVRSPMLDTWEGIKQLKAALWALVSILTCPPHSLGISLKIITEQLLRLIVDTVSLFPSPIRATLAHRTGV